MGIGGSLHCLGMCGPLVMSFTKTHTDNMLYQLGRLVGYMSIGLIIKVIGQFFFTKNQSTIVFVAGILLGLFYIFQGLSLLKIIKELKINFNLHQKVRHIKFLKNSTGIGFLSAFLPCGLLYTTLFSLLVVQDLRLAFLSILAFWLGTVPALFFSSVLMQKAIRPTLLKVPKLAGTLLLTIGLCTVVLRLYPFIIGEKNCMHCYLEQK